MAYRVELNGRHDAFDTVATSSALLDKISAYLGHPRAHMRVIMLPSGHELTGTSPMPEEPLRAHVVPATFSLGGLYAGEYLDLKT